VTDDIVPSDLKKERSTALPGEKCLGVGSWGRKVLVLFYLGGCVCFCLGGSHKDKGISSY